MKNFALIMTLFAVFSDVTALVADIDDSELSGEIKFKAVCEGAGEIIDERLDDIPLWSEISEAARDRIVGGLVELAVQVYHATHPEVSIKTRFLKLTRVRRIDRFLKKAASKLD